MSDDIWERYEREYGGWTWRSKIQEEVVEEGKETVVFGKKYCAVINPAAKGYKGIVSGRKGDIVAMINDLEKGNTAPGGYTWYPLDEYKDYKFAIITKHDWHKLGFVMENEWGVESP